MTPIRVARLEDATLREAAAAMMEAGVGAIVIEGPRPAILTERDMLPAIAAGEDLDTTTVGGYVRRDRPTARPEDPIGEVATRMTDASVRHVLVMESGRVVGMLSMRDVVGVLGALHK